MAKLNIEMFGENSILIKSDILKIRNLLRNDISDEYINTLNDKSLMRYSLQSLKKHNYASCAKYIKDVQKRGDSLFGIFLNNTTSHFVGNITVSYYAYNNSADLSVIIFKNHLLKGYAKTAFSMIIKYLFEIKKIRKITIGTCVQNIQMINLAESVNMTPDGIRKKQYILNDKEHDVIHYALFNEKIKN